LVPWLVYQWLPNYPKRDCLAFFAQFSLKNNIYTVKGFIGNLFLQRVQRKGAKLMLDNITQNGLFSKRTPELNLGRHRCTGVGDDLHAGISIDDHQIGANAKQAPPSKRIDW